MLVREYHGFTVISAREEEPSKDGDGWDHAVVLKDGSVMAPLGTLAEAIHVCKLGRELEEKNPSHSTPADMRKKVEKAALDIITRIESPVAE